MTKDDEIEPTPNVARDDEIEPTPNIDIDEQAIDEQQRIHEEQLQDEEYDAEEKQQEKVKEIEEYKSGKILYEEVLTGMLQQANTAFQRNKHTSFCRTVQSIWNNCYRADREEIYREVEKMADEQIGIKRLRELKKEIDEIKDNDPKEIQKKVLAMIKKEERTQLKYRTEEYLDPFVFMRLMKTDLRKPDIAFGTRNYNGEVINPPKKPVIFVLGMNYNNKWRTAYQIIQERLRKKYHGTVKQFIKDTLDG